LGRPNCDGTWVADEVMGPRERPKEGTTSAVKRPASVAGSHPLLRLFGAGLPPRARNQATPTSLDLKGLCPTGALSDRHCRLRRRSVLATRLAAVLASSGSDHALAGLAPDHALAGLVPDHGPGWLVPDRRPGWLAPVLSLRCTGSTSPSLLSQLPFLGGPGRDRTCDQGIMS
jgi:hypothetical protein